MFSGIIEETAKVSSIRRGKSSFCLTVQSNLDHKDTKPGDSIAICGVCLTVTKNEGGLLEFDVGTESFRRSTLAFLKPGDRVNFERALLFGGRVHGHLVTGHVDGIASLISRTVEENTEKYVFELPADLKTFVAPKGSVSVSGVSLTVGEVTESAFCVYVIPHTADLTTLPSLKPGDKVNIEIDILARYVGRAMSGGKGSDDRLLSVLEKSGFIAGGER